MGYLVLDHRACDPTIQRTYGGLKEFDTVHCQHCETVILKVHWQKAGGTCHSCGDVCYRCAAAMQTVGCVKSSLHFRRRVDAAIRRQSLFDAAGLV